MKFIILSTLFFLFYNSSFSISAVDSLKADSCGYALGKICSSINELSESNFCKLNYYTSKLESNIITPEQFIDSISNLNTELLNFIDNVEQMAGIMIRNDFTLHDSITGFNEIMNDRWDEELDSRPNVGCYNYISAMQTCKLNALLCIDGAAISCSATGPFFPLCLSAMTVLCLLSYSDCASNASEANPGCAGGGSGGSGGILWQPWIVNPPLPVNNINDCN